MAPDNIATIRQHLRMFDFTSLFIEELGWDRHNATLPIDVDGRSFVLRSFAEKRGVQILECPPCPDGAIPERSIRQKIEKKVARATYEHLIIFVDNAKSQQVWQWVARRPGQPAAYREHSFHAAHQTGDALIQKLDAITFSLNDEEGLTLTGVAFALRDAFDRDRVTKRFFDVFKQEHGAFLDFIAGITEQGDREWYASLMLNRLMFIYFIQRKGFLDSDTDYLRNRLQMVRERHGEDKFHSFYRYFLLRLFHEGFGQQPGRRAKDLEPLLGRIPYLNGGLFDVHELERKHVDIDIPDDAFERLFAFFDQYDWHLDTRPLQTGREINPDVLGYIFEKYINQKQMGAYYTKEDITEYIGKNTILPYLFDAAKKKCAIAFQAGSALWRLLVNDPDRYIYPAMRKGVINEHGEIIPLPGEIEPGVHDVGQRGNWNTPAAPEYGLPTEIWREHVARRQRCLEIRKKLKDGEVHAINDLITYNLDIRQFAEDVIATCEGPELLRAMYQAISGVTVLDPTCGSGAFLFAALNILEPLYEACLDRMQAFVEDLERSGEAHRPEKFSDFKKVLAEVDRHPNRSYFILKSIVVNNLYGVDIMEEAVEICKLRLFLTLVAQVDKANQLEPLPDIDFNVRAGNTLIGFVSVDEIRKAAEYDQAGKTKQLRLLDSKTNDRIRNIEEDAEIVDRAYKRFHEMQTTYGMDAAEFSNAKLELKERLKQLDEKLDRYLAKEYAIDPDNQQAFTKWKKSHQPFHWFVEFYGIMSSGFDVIIGNPPYVVYSRAKVDYDIERLNYQTLSTKNLYAFIFERSVKLVKKNSPIGLIVQLTVLTSGKLPPLQRLLISRGYLYSLPFPRRPESIFDGVEMPVAILLSFANSEKSFVTSRVSRMYTEERPITLNTITLSEHRILNDGCRIAKIGTDIEKQICRKIELQKHTLNSLTQGNDPAKMVYYQEACRYWLKAGIGMPYFRRNGKSISPPHGRFIFFESTKASQFVGCLLNSSLFYWYYSIFSDCEHVNDQLVKGMPIPTSWNDSAWKMLSERLAESLATNATPKTIKTKEGHTIEYEEMKAMLSKAEIDQIDRALAIHYGFTDEELDSIINYDIKYRMGLSVPNGGKE